MKFVCDRCQTRYSIADEKVRQKILKIRCKTCDNVITVKDSAEPSGSTRGSAATSRASASMQAVRVSSTSLPVATSRPPGTRPTTPPVPPPRPDVGPVEWHVAIDGTDAGPFNRLDLARRVVSAKPDAEIYVWKDGFDGWKDPKDVPEIAREMQAIRLRAPGAVPPPPLGKRSSSGLPPPSGRSVSLSSLATAAAEAKADRKAALPAPTDPFEGEATQVQSIDSALVAESVPPGRSTGRHGAAAALDRPGAAALGSLSSTGLENLDLAPSSSSPQHAAASMSLPPLSATPLSRASSTAMPVAGESALVRMAGVGLFARNPAMKYVVAAGGFVLLLIVVVIANVGGSSDVKPTTHGRPTTPTPGAPKPAEDPEAEARRKAEAWFGRTDHKGGSETPSKAVVAGNPNQKPSLIKRLMGRGGADKGGNNTAPPPVGAMQPPPVAANDVAESRKVAADLQERAARLYSGNTPPAGGGEVSQDKIRNVITSKINQDALKSCYNRALRHDGANLKGRMDVTVSIGASGRVKHVSLSSGPELQPVHGCVKTAITRWVFPASREDYGTEFPFILQGS